MQLGVISIKVNGNTYAVGHALSSPLLGHPIAVEAAHLHFGASAGQFETLIAARHAFLLVAEHPRVLRRRRVLQARPALLRLAVVAFEVVGAVAHVGRGAEAQVLARRIADCCRSDRIKKKNNSISILKSFKIICPT